MEGTYRQHFIQLQVARHLQEAQELRNKQREILLRAMVPSHVIENLLIWMQNGMRMEESIVATLPKTIVAFLHFDAPPALHYDENYSQYFRDNPTTDLGVLSANLPRDGRWLITLHEKVDQILQLEFNSSVIKIKTIGDVAMLGGPFAESSASSNESVPSPASRNTKKGEVSSSTGQLFENVDELDCDDLGNPQKYILEKAGRELMETIFRISNEVSTDFRTGIHVGELVGGVLGTNRLCFDIFGDSVNTASRIMTSGSTGDFSVSKEFLDCIDSLSFHDSCIGEGSSPATLLMQQRGDDDGTAAVARPPPAFSVHYGDPLTVAAKGKGEITVYRLNFILNPVAKTSDNSGHKHSTLTNNEGIFEQSPHSRVASGLHLPQ